VNRLSQQIRFIVEIDKLKQVVRQTILMDRSRAENSAEHSWHLALMALVLSEHAAFRQVDVGRVLKMVLIHDLVEIDAGDTFCYDEGPASASKTERETAGAERIFNLLPEDQAKTFRALWDEFEKAETPESRFARALDRLQPVLHNYLTKGMAWRKHGIRKSQVLGRNQVIEDGAPALWSFAKAIIEEAAQKGYLASDPS
jgi:putative hydrolases of HD superfamily